MIAETYKGGKIRIESKPRYDPLLELISSRPPERGNFVTFTGHEEEFFRNQSLDATTVFERNRNRVRNSLQKLIGFLWEKYNLPKEDIVEYGSGSTGYFDAVLRPGSVPHWQQFEINPKAVAENKKRNPDAIAEEGSYKRINRRNLAMVLGLSSWDTSENLPQAMQQVADALKDGGYFFHIQDVRPGVGCVMSYLEKAVGCSPTHGWTVPVKGRTEDTDLLGLMVEGQRRTLPDIFKNAIEHGLKSEAKMDLLVNDYFTLYEVLDSRPIIPGFVEIYFLNFYGARPTESQIVHNSRERETTVLVTLAKRKPRE